MCLTECLWLADSRITWATLAARLCGVAVIVGVQPVHVNADVIPKRNYEDHATVQSLTHGFQASFLAEVITVTKQSFLRSAKLSCF